MTTILQIHRQLTQVWGIWSPVTAKVLSFLPIPLRDHGWEVSHAIQNRKEILERLKDYLPFIPKDLHCKITYFGFHQCTRQKYREIISLIQCMPVNSMRSVVVIVDKHAMTLNIIKTPIGYDVIFINRGATKSFTNKATVQVYSFSYTEEIERLLNISRKIYRCQISDQTKKQFYEFINSDTWQSRFNFYKSSLLSLQQQKIGNCTIANTTPLWNLELALHDVRLGLREDYIDAFLHQKRYYKTLRLFDRALALYDFMQQKDAFVQSDYLKILTAVFVKSQRKGEQFTTKLIAALQRINENVTSQITEALATLMKTNYLSSKYLPELKQVLQISFQYDCKRPPLVAKEVESAIAQWQILLSPPPSLTQLTATPTCT